MTSEQDIKNDINDLLQLIKKDSYNWKAYVDLINLLIFINNFVDAEILALKALTFFMKNNEAKNYISYSLANLYYLNKKYNKSIIFLDKINITKLDEDKKIMYGKNYFNKKLYKKALVYILTVYENDKNNIEIKKMLANIWLSLGNYNEAKLIYDEILNKQNYDFEVNFSRGIIAAVEGELSNKWFLKAEMIDNKKYQINSENINKIYKNITGENK